MDVVRPGVDRRGPNRIIIFNNKYYLHVKTVHCKVSGVRKQLSKEVFLRRRILFFCMLRGAIARENALCLMKPFKVVDGVVNLNII